MCMCVCVWVHLLKTPSLDLISAETDGFVKILSDKKTDRMLGAHMIGSVSNSIVISKGVEG